MSPTTPSGFLMENIHSFEQQISSVLPEVESLWPSQPLFPQEEPECSTAGSYVYKCEICAKVFSISSQLKRHQKDHEKPELCMSCDKRFPTKSELRRHEQSVHESSKRFYCKMVPCKYNKTGSQDEGTYFGNDIYFGRLAAVRRHLKEVHRISDNLDTWIEEEKQEEPIETLAEKLLSAQIEHPYGSNSYFIPIDQLENLLVETNIRQELRKIFPTMDEEKIEFYTHCISSSSRKLFAVLLCTSSGAQGNQSRAICSFIEEGVTDIDLPFERLYPSHPDNPALSLNQAIFTLARKPHASSSKELGHTPLVGFNAVLRWPRLEVQNFSREQWLVLAPVFEGPPGTTPLDLCFQNSIVLPFKEDGENDEELLKFGGYCEMWPVRIHPAHQKLLTPTSRSGPEPRIAVKRLYSRKLGDFEKERKMKSQLALQKHPHLVRLLITFKLKGRFYLLYPYAQYNLREYWKTHARPVSRHAYLWSLQQICGLASALIQIHKFSTEPTSTEDAVESAIVNPKISRERPSLNVRLVVDRSEAFFGRHGDLKPENILWFDDLEGVDPLGILQITDFGVGRFHRLESGSKKDPAKINGSSSYTPPELILDKLVSRAYDIWSLGCLFLEFITWIIDGYDGLERFALARRATAFDGIVDDTYYTLFVTSTGQRRVEVREGVTNWIRGLRSNQRCSRMIIALLDLVQDRMLQVDSGDRIHADGLDVLLHEVLERAKKDNGYPLSPSNPTLECQVYPHVTSIERS